MTSHPFTLDLIGALDAEAAPEIRDRFDALIAAGHSSVALNFAKVDFIDSSGIGAVVYLFKRLGEQEATLSLEEVGGQPLQLLKLLRVDSIVQVTPKQEAA